MKIHTKAGQYVAICNKTNFDGYYCKSFEFPVEYAEQGFNASWYFLNILDLTACLEIIMPLDEYQDLTSATL